MAETNPKGKTVKLEFKELTLWKTGAVVFAVLFIIAIFTGGFGRGSGEAGAVPNLPQNPQAPQAGEKVDVEVGGAFVMGDEDAPVTMIEFSDFQCPFCARFFSETLPQIEEKYIKTGKVKLAYKHLPLVIHSDAQKAGEAAECAGNQGKFWEMHDMIFQNQQAIGVADLKRYAADLKLDTAKFGSCLDGGKTAAKVNAHNAEAARVGASGTPTFFINGQRVIGAQPYPAFEAVIEAELAK